MIKSFKNKKTEQLFKGVLIKGIDKRLVKRARIKLRGIDAAVTLADLRIPPSNHLEKLIGDREGQYSIKVNDRYRICFFWKDNEALEVEFVDYH